VIQIQLLTRVGGYRFFCWAAGFRKVAISFFAKYQKLRKGQNRYQWIMASLFLPIVGPISYLIFGTGHIQKSWPFFPISPRHIGYKSNFHYHGKIPMLSPTIDALLIRTE